MAKKLTDAEFLLKRRARRRLIGVVALTTVVVVLLPMVLDREPRPVGQNIELRIPDKDKVGGFVSRVEGPARAPAALPSASTAVSPMTDDQPAAGRAATGLPGITTPPPEVNQRSPVVEKSGTAKPEHKNTPLAAETKTAGSGQTAPPESDATSGFVVQVGAFSVTETAHRWQRNLQNQGIKAYTEKAGDKVRVRAGPYPTREAAERVRHRLELQGLKAVVSPVR
jgi:DedD protein